MPISSLFSQNFISHSFLIFRKSFFIMRVNCHLNSIHEYKYNLYSKKHDGKYIRSTEYFNDLIRIFLLLININISKEVLEQVNTVEKYPLIKL